MTWRVLAGVALVGTLLCACSSVSPADAMRSWASSNSFGQAVTDLLYDSSRVHQAIDQHQSAASVRTYCSELFSDANGENTDLLPTPDPQLTSSLSTSFDEFIHAAYACTKDAGEASEQRHVMAQCHRAIGVLVLAVLREEAVAGRSLGVTGIA